MHPVRRASAEDLLTYIDGLMAKADESANRDEYAYAYGLLTVALISARSRLQVDLMSDEAVQDLLKGAA